MRRVGFLLNHYDLHQVPHIVPYAFELSRLRDDFDVVIYCSSAAEERFARTIGAGYGAHRARFERLHVPLWARVLDPLVNAFVFLRKDATLNSNAGLFGKLDALVVPEMTSLRLRERPEFGTTKLIFTGHGAGDNRHGGSFNARIGQFDLALMPGRKYASGLQEVGFLQKDRYAISGYPKLEAMRKAGGARRRFFDNDRPVVLYNPHHARSISSWPRFGTDVLDYFLDQQDYNLIFAPHVLLFRRAWTRGASLPARYKSTTTVLIDKAGPFSSDMTYLRSADIYLGDVSSQVYEFLETPRPCVFLDGHDTYWQNDPSYLHWTLGPVVRDVGDLPGALAEARATAPHYAKLQAEAFSDTFEISGEEAGLRGARIIADFLETGGVDPRWQ